MALFRRKSVERAADGSMSLMEHLYELRTRLFWVVVAILGGSIISFVWFANGIPAIHLKSLGDIVTGPFCALDPKYRNPLDNQGCALIGNSPFSALNLRLKVALMAGSVISSPFWFYQIWSFITPALYSKERRFATIFVSFATVLFVAGAVLAYVVIGEGLRVLLGIGGDTVGVLLAPQEYFSFFIALLIIFGTSFELPLILIMLNVIGVLKGAQLAKWRRYSIFGITVFAGLTVPGNDPITMLALVVSLSLLYEVSVQVSKINDKRRGRVRQEEGLGDLDDDQASNLDLRPSGVDGTGDIEPPAPVAPARKPLEDGTP